MVNLENSGFFCRNPWKLGQNFVFFSPIFVITIFLPLHCPPPVVWKVPGGGIHTPHGTHTAAALGGRRGRWRAETFLHRS